MLIYRSDNIWNSLSLTNEYTLMFFDRNINGNRDVKFFEWDYWSLHGRNNLSLILNTKEILGLFLSNLAKSYDHKIEFAAYC